MTSTIATTSPNPIEMLDDSFISSTVAALTDLSPNNAAVSCSATAVAVRGWLELLTEELAISSGIILPVADDRGA
jgi:hypothetical protein